MSDVDELADKAARASLCVHCGAPADLTLILNFRTLSKRAAEDPTLTWARVHAPLELGVCIGCAQQMGALVNERMVAEHVPTSTPSTN